MNINGTYTFQASPEVVWTLLMDIQTLHRTIQGIERLERTGEDTYAFTLHIKHASLRGSYSENASEDNVTQLEVSHIHNGHMAISTFPEKSSFLHTIVRQLGLGDNDLLLEQQWVNRLRRIGIVSMLLFLVWVGTRLPRRFLTR